MLTETAPAYDELLKGLLRAAALRALGSRVRVVSRMRRIGRSNCRIVRNLHRVGLPDGSAYAGWAASSWSRWAAARATCLELLQACGFDITGYEPACQHKLQITVAPDGYLKPIA